MTELTALFSRHQTLYETIAASHPSLLNGKVICSRCAKTRVVEAARCLRDGWPKCCGATVSLAPVKAEAQKP